jgi:hypothetical protein
LRWIDSGPQWIATGAITTVARRHPSIPPTYHASLARHVIAHSESDEVARAIWWETLNLRIVASRVEGIDQEAIRPTALRLKFPYRPAQCDLFTTVLSAIVGASARL